ncbi:MAG: efflux RND transporter permease subunit [Polyangiaceae bacterium]
MTKNAVASNLLMLVLIIGGLLTLPSIKQEVFPEFELDFVLVTVPYPGASPSEVEQGVVLALEEAVRSVDGIKEVRGTASEGVGTLVIELLLGTNTDRALADVKSAVDRVTSFPKDVERPVVSLAQSRRQVVSIVVHGDASEKALREYAERVRDDLLSDGKITLVELSGVRPPEVSIEVPREQLRRYGLTLDQIAQRVGAASVEIPGGGVKTPSGEVLLRTAERRERGAEFAAITLLSRPDGSEVKVGDIAQVKDDFRETDQEAFFNGRRAAMVNVFRVGDQTPLAISEVVNRYVEEHRSSLPPGVDLSIWSDTSEVYADRIDLLRRNANLGLILVVVVLGMFLELRLALWVTLGIPISFIGSLLFLPAWGASINMISLFAFIVCLGIVVDDAIVVGEAVYTKTREGMSRMDAAIAGVREVAVPVVFAVATTLVAFAPMLFVPGPAGKFFRLIPIVVIAVLTISLVESLLVLPAHLAHKGMGVLVPTGALSIGLLLGLPYGAKYAIGFAVGALLIGGVVMLVATRIAEGRIFRYIENLQQRFSRFVEWFVEHYYVPVIDAALTRRYLTLAVSVAIFLSVMGLVAGGRVNFTFLPRVDSDVVVGQLEMPFGTSVDETRAVNDRMVKRAQALLDEMGGGKVVGRGIFSQVGNKGAMAGGPSAAVKGSGGSHLAEVAVFLVPLKDRSFSSTEFSRRWRETIGEVPGVRTLKFGFSTGPSAGSAVDIALSHKDLGVLESAATRVAEKLGEYNGVYDIDNGFAAGKEQLDLRLLPSARVLGLTETDLARQVRSSFFGAEAVRQQRGRDELRVYVRLPKAERSSEHDIEELVVRTPGGGEIPLAQAAELKRGSSYTSIQRKDGRRVVRVTAEVDEGVANANKVIADVQRDVLPGILADYDGVTYSLEGEQKNQAETMASLGKGFVFALIAIFGLLAVVFRSYAQPIIIMAVIPFGMVGAVLGHVAMGYDMSLMSMMGVVALSGVVVNDSLILVDAANGFRAQGLSRREAIVSGGARRFRPILLTSLTTFFGLIPMITETSMQARFLIPMAISLGFGVLLSTIICLILVPSAYAIVDDIKLGWEALLRFITGREGPASSPAPGE